MIKTPPQFDPEIFRTYDIRGIAEKNFTSDHVFFLGKAIASKLLEQGGKQLFIARDGRHSSPQLAQALAQGILSTGCNVIDLGLAPTPVLYFAVYKNLPNDVFSSGIMLTGSHNPPEYNGIKMVLAGVTLSEQEIVELHQRIQDSRFATGQGVYQTVSQVEAYAKAVQKNVRITPRKIVIDAGHGVTGGLAPHLFQSLGCEVVPLYCEVDGDFPHHHPDPSDAKNLVDLIEAVRAEGADLGLAFDGDGDRLGVVTAEGEVICPDRLLMFFAKNILAQQDLGEKIKIIFDVKCSQHLTKLIADCGGEPIMWKTGHSLIKAKMAESGALLAGEMSGHFFFKDKWYGFDDALYAGARLLEMLNKYENSANAFAHIPNSVNTPELKITVAEQEKFTLMQQLIDRAQFHSAENVNTIDGIRVNFSEGWGLIRPSNTTPNLILRFEAVNENILQQIQNIFRDWILSVRSDLVIPF